MEAGVSTRRDVPARHAEERSGMSDGKCAGQASDTRTNTRTAVELDVSECKTVLMQAPSVAVSGRCRG